MGHLFSQYYALRTWDDNERPDTWELLGSTTGNVDLVQTVEVAILLHNIVFMVLMTLCKTLKCNVRYENGRSIHMRYNWQS